MARPQPHSRSIIFPAFIASREYLGVAFPVKKGHKNVCCPD